MNDDDHIRGLGQIVGNLLSLEMILRVFLAYLRNQTLEVPTAADQLVKERFLPTTTALDRSLTFTILVSLSENNNSLSTRTLSKSATRLPMGDC